jgi:SAM-dependent methyltransferase
MVSKCGVCSGNLKEIIPVPGSSRGNIISICQSCAILQYIESGDYIPENDPHSIKFSGERHIEPSQGAMWGNIRHGKGLRLDAHKSLLLETIKNSSPKFIFDDGANRGHFARFVSENFTDIKYIGCEPDPICFESYQDNNTPKIYENYTENHNLKNKVDFIYSCHTLEHVDSVYDHMKKISSSLKNEGILFLDLPNTENINYEDLIFEEYFVEKHKYNFMLDDVLNILFFSGFRSNIIHSDPFNITIVAKKIDDSSFQLSKAKSSEEKVNKIVKEVLEYYEKMERSNEAFKNICENINNFKKNSSVVFYGGGRLLLSFISKGLNSQNIEAVIDNYLFDKTKFCGDNQLFHSDKLNEISKETPIIIFGRSSTDSIKNNLFSLGFSEVKSFIEFN